ncbi:hypothetical protein TraAM80_06200 [Trypanosoma rangeli]|uniref:Uncharacterized protein n=1 Tax=Trypanosoma rangeli TaxID=5698 RepID=A0A3R7KWV3_TRYRA|nr:uncharacterized protein TraAM80_06200 [Trypanosoma rangeli]RNF02965.1 hypothetical protein TraAM80_06200 [Trypanosoma rangeli]|eukprot:RNF02965.1 hypothetical protein TraAM80_06200 [Trypanosoma rangeli]
MHKIVVVLDFANVSIARKACERDSENEAAEVLPLQFQSVRPLPCSADRRRAASLGPTPLYGALRVSTGRRFPARRRPSESSQVELWLVLSLCLAERCGMFGACPGGKKMVLAAFCPLQEVRFLCEEWGGVLLSSATDVRVWPGHHKEVVVFQYLLGALGRRSDAA